jgi:hypothetical protein
VAAVLVAALVLVGCGNKSEEQATGGNGAPDVGFVFPFGSDDDGGEEGGGTGAGSGTNGGSSGSVNLPEGQSESVVGMFSVDDEWAERKLADDSRVREALSVVFTWDTGDKYYAARDSLYGDGLNVDKDAVFAKSMFPEGYENGTNMRFLGIDSYVTGGKPTGDVEYFALVRVQSMGMNDFKANGEVAMTYSVSKAGVVKVSDMVPLTS